MALRLRLRTPSRYILYSGQRWLSSNNQDKKTKDVKEATHNLLEAVGKAMPPKSAIAAALVALSPVISPSVKRLYEGVAQLADTPTNQALAALAALRDKLGVGTGSKLQLPPISPHAPKDTQSTATQQEPDAADAHMVQFQNWLRAQPPGRTCHEAADDLQAWVNNSNKAK